MIQNSDIDSKLVVAIHFSHFDPGYYIWATFRKPQKVKFAKNGLCQSINLFANMIQNCDIDSKLVVTIHFSHFDPGHTALVVTLVMLVFTVTLWSLLLQGASVNQCSEIYRGPRPFSEPETNAVKRFIMDRSRGVKHEANGNT